MNVWGIRLAWVGQSIMYEHRRTGQGGGCEGVAPRLLEKKTARQYLRHSLVNSSLLYTCVIKVYYQNNRRNSYSVILSSTRDLEWTNRSDIFS